ncbi:MAG: response regulator [Verrucomicrobia subdivision 3 bacterium]|nr:response regulator [Limisphaerales bacterium]
MINPAPILHVEDREDDQFFLKRAFDAVGIQNTIHFLNDGQIAVDYLSGQAPYADRQAYPIPCLIILDLKLPQLHGLDVLKWIRAHREFKSIVVVILSSSPLRNDVDLAYEAGVNSFIVKPLTADQMTNIARLVKEYWLETNEFPSVCEMKDPPRKLGVKPPRRFKV